MWAVWTMIATLGAVFLSCLLAFAADSNDLPWQRNLGRQILRLHHVPTALPADVFAASGAPWTPHEWLFSLFVALCGRGPGFVLLAVATALATVGVFLVTARHARQRGAAPWSIVVVLLFVAITMLNGYGLRVQVFGWLFLACFLRWSHDERKELRLIPLTVLWANVHASVLLAPCFAICTLVGRLWSLVAARIEGSQTYVTGSALQRAALLTLGVGLATLCTPLGIALPLYALHLVASPYLHDIQEWQATSMMSSSFARGGFPLLAILILFGSRSRLSREEMPRTLLLLSLLFASVRQIPVAAIGLAPIAALALTNAIAGIANPALWYQRSKLLICGMYVLLTVEVGFAATAFYRSPAEREVLNSYRPLAAYAVFARDANEHRIFCEDFSACSLFIDLPNIHALIDGRVDPFPPPVWQAWEDVKTVKPTWKEILRTYRIDRVLAVQGTLLDQTLQQDGLPITRDSHYDLYRISTDQSSTQNSQRKP